MHVNHAGTRPGRHRSRLLATAAAIALAAAALTTNPAPAAAAAASAQASPLQVTGNVTGTGSTARPVTLLTGDTVTVTSSGAGRYSATQAAGGRSPMIITTTGKPGTGASAVYAIPLSAAALVTDGALDRDMFDALWLADHSRGGFDVVLQYAGHPAAGWLAQHGAALAGASVTATSAADATVTVQVPAAKAAGFWTAITGQHESGQPAKGISKPALADGITRAWLAGHQTPAAVRPAGQPLHTLTVTVTRKGGLIPEVTMLFGVTGAGADTAFFPSSQDCLDPDCTSGFQDTYLAPDGVYEAFEPSNFYSGDHLQRVDASDPQVTVAGDTSVSIDADKAAKVTVGTPRPSTAYTGLYADYRTTADGGFLASGVYTYDYTSTIWAVPTTSRVTVGSYHFESKWVLGAPPVTMTVAGNDGLQLHPSYAKYNDTTDPQWPSFLHFSGDHVYPLVYAGHGSAADFSGVDARGKLALITVNEDGGCQFYDSQLDAAKQAGAVGVIIDPRDPTQTYSGGYCDLPIYDYQSVGALPYVSVPGDEAAQLMSSLNQGQVRIRVADGGETPYLYFLNLDEEGHIPATLNYKLTGRQLSQVDARYHYPTPVPMSLGSAAWRSNAFVSYAKTYLFEGPGGITEYYGPVSPDQVWETDLETEAGDFKHEWKYNVFTGGRSTTDGLTEPTAPGAALQEDTAAQVKPNFPQNACTMCRQGDFFYPAAMLVSGADPWVTRQIGNDHPMNAELYTDSGTPVPPATDHGWAGYDLPAQQARYRFVTSTEQTDTTWSFASARPAADNEPVSSPCIGTIVGFSTDPCAALPLIFLRYNANVDMSDAVTAHGAHQLTVTPYYQAIKAPGQINAMKLWTSTDGGKTWQQVGLHLNPDGSYTATYQLPAASSTTGTVSIKAQASDSAGNTVDQTIIDAYDITAAH